MSKSAVLAVWTMVGEGVDTIQRDDDFRARILPAVQALPGYVRGVWARSADGTRSYNTVVFENQEGAEGLIAQIEDNKPYSSAAGVHLHSLEVLDVIDAS